MILTCTYVQKYYLSNKTKTLSRRIIGPSHILEGPTSELLDPDVFHGLPEPEEPDSKKN